MADIAWNVPVATSRLYQVRAAEPLLDPANPYLLCGGAVPGRRFVVFDGGVPEPLRAELAAYFDAHDVLARILTLPGGEGCKGMDTVLKIVCELERFGLDRRQEPMIVVGGGAVLDVGGFAASIYRRGVPFVRVPTTLLAYVDASVGIKTAVNHGRQKNLIGSFTPPEIVLLDRRFLQSLPTREVSSGLGEILKLGVGCDVTLLELLEAEASGILTQGFDAEAPFQILQRAIEVMLRELRSNLHELDLCRPVDLGHTFSQVFEMLPGDDALRHGEAVALDVNLSAILSARRGWLRWEDVDRIARLTEQLGLPMSPPERVEPSALWSSVLERTRHRAGRQRAPLPLRLGECAFADDLTPGEIFGAFEELRAGRWRLNQVLP